MIRLGVQINMISESRLKRLTSAEKIALILEDVMNGHVVVLECGLDPFEEARLIESTMLRIRDDAFLGIEIQSYPHKERLSALDRLTKRDSKRLTVIGPADRMKTIRAERDLISAFIT